MKKYCPLKFTHHSPDWTCEEEDCAWWNERYAMCSQVVDAYLKGQEDWQREKEIIRKGG